MMLYVTVISAPAEMDIVNFKLASDHAVVKGAQFAVLHIVVDQNNTGTLCMRLDIIHTSGILKYVY